MMTRNCHRFMDELLFYPLPGILILENQVRFINIRFLESELQVLVRLNSQKSLRVKFSSASTKFSSTCAKFSTY
jgi:hypothetical protein